MTYEIFLKINKHHTETTIGIGDVHVEEVRRCNNVVDYNIKLDSYYRCSKEIYENISSNILAGKTPKHIRMTASVATNDESYFFKAETVEVTWEC